VSTRAQQIPFPADGRLHTPWLPRLAALLRSAGARQGLTLGVAMLVAGVLDYAVNVVAGRWLAPVEFGVFVAVTALLQVLLSVATTMRMVVAYYTADAVARPGDPGVVNALLRGAAGWCGRWGLVTAGAMALGSGLLARVLRLPGPAPLWAAAAMVLAMFLREPAFGALQGIQAFGRLGRAQVGQGVLRLALAVVLVLAGLGAAGAVLAQALAAIGAVALALPSLRPHLTAPAAAAAPRVRRSYVLATVLGLAVFGVLTNLDALFVKVAFPAQVAGDFAPAVTLEKMSLFLPWAISFVLFPKATQRIATGRDPRPLLLASLAAVLVPGLLMSAAYLAAPGPIVRAIFTGAYADPGVVLCLVSLAGTLYAGVNIWLNYALSTGRSRYVHLLLGVVALQAAALWAFGRAGLTAVGLVMVGAGVLGNLAGIVALGAAPASAPASDDGATPAARPGSPRRLRLPSVTAVLAVGGAALAAGYVVLLLGLDGLPYQDVPNHVARAVITSDLLFDGGRRFGDRFTFQPMLAPYILHDLGLAALVRVLGPYLAGRAWMVLSLLSLPAAVAVFLRSRGYARHTVVLACVLCLYLGTDFTFVTGFTSYRLALAVTVLSLAAWQGYLESGSRRALVGWIGGLLGGYLLHLSAPFFAGFAAVALAGLAARRRGRELALPTAVLPRAALGLAPLLLLAAWQLRTAGVAPPGDTRFQPPFEKLTGAFLPFHRYDLPTEAGLFLLLAAALALAARGWRTAGREAIAPALVALLFFALYAALPYGQAYISYIDLRALPFAWLFVVIAALGVADRARPSWAVAALSLALVAANQAVLSGHLLRHDAVMRDYRRIAAQLPENATFVPVVTRPRDGTTNPYLHAGNFATIERGARSPYLFSAGVTSYFRPHQYISAPSEFWYQKGIRPNDGTALACAYRYLLVLTPMDWRRLPVPTRLLAGNATAELREVTRPPCPRGFSW
jgi:O-antigen/teichoic acid export membrane protein